MFVRQWMQQGWAIARLTALEALRQPIALLLMTAAVLSMAVLPLVLSHTLGDSARMIADSTLSLHFLFGLFLAGFAACHALAEEARRGTGAMVLSKPVPRELFYAAKFAGLAVALSFFSATVTAAALLSVRTAAQAYQPDLWSAVALLVCAPFAFALAAVVNYLTRRPFVSDAFLLLALAVLAAFLTTAFLDREGRWTAFGFAFDFRLVRAGLLIGMAVWLLAALALGLATRMGVVPTLTICSVLFLVGLMSDYLFGRVAALHGWARFAHTLLPNWNHFWVADALHTDEPIPWSYVGRAARYGTLYLIGVLALGMLSFRRMEVKNG